MAVKRTNRTFAGAAIADAAYVRMCSTVDAASRCGPLKQSFANVIFVRTEVSRSLKIAWTIYADERAVLP